MDGKLKDYYEARFEMMSGKGWVDLMEDVTNIINSLSDVMSIKDEKDLLLRQGQLANLEWLKGLKTSSESVFQELVEEDKNANHA